MAFYGGAELVVVKLLNYMTKKGIKNTLLTMSLSPEIKKEIKGTEVVVAKGSLLSKPGAPYSLAIAPMVSTFVKYLRKNPRKFDVINAHNFPAELVALFCEERVVWMCNEPPQLNFAGPSLIEKSIGGVVVKLDRMVVKNHVDCVCVADEFNARRFEKIYGVKPVVIPYGVDSKFFATGNAAKARKKFKLGRDDFILLQVGMITPFKNQMESVRAAAALKDKIPNLKLVLAGTGEKGYEKSLRELVKKSGLEKNVIFTGHVPRADVRDLYAACDVAVFPVKPQGGWLSPFEALCAGKPVVVSTQMTAHDMIKKNNMGVVTDDLVNAILDIRKNLVKYRKMAGRGRQWVGKNLSWDRFCEKMVENFKDAST
jgi:glycosyltransferase involved in cell wall biosynthesis